MKYRLGDEVVLKVEDSFGYTVKTFSPLKVMVLGCDVDVESSNAQYLCYVPVYERIPVGFGTFKIDRLHARHFRVDAKYVGQIGCFITAKYAIYKHIQAVQGEKCDHCRDFFEGATRVDGAYRCRACRENPWR